MEVCPVFRTDPIKQESNAKVGRYLFDGKNKKDVLSKLEQAWLWGCTDKEACLWAGISVVALQRYQNKDEEFRGQKQLFQLALFKPYQTLHFSLNFKKDKLVKLQVA